MYSVENQQVCFEDEKRPRVCLPSLKKVSYQAKTAVAFLDSLFRKALVSKWTIAIVRESSQSASAFAPRFLQLSSSRNSSRFFANSNQPTLLGSRSVQSTTYRLAFSQRSVFPRTKKVSSTCRKNIFEAVKSSSRANSAEMMTGLLYTIGHVRCLNKPPSAKYSTMQVRK